MVVWDISQQTIPCFTDRAVTHDAISHCYERLTTSDWPYNIYTMMHGRTQADIEKRHGGLKARFRGDTPHYEALYTLKEYKKQ